MQPIRKFYNPNMTLKPNTDRKIPAVPRWAILLITVLIAVMTLPAVGAAEHPSEIAPEPVFHIALSDNGSAAVNLVVVFDLSTTEEQNAFELLRANGTAREQRSARFASRMRTVANRTAVKTGREMHISRPSITFFEHNNTGLAILSISWEGLAAQSGGELVVSEPFASGLTIDRSLHVVAPEGYSVSTVRPDPDLRAKSEVVWNAGSSLDGYEAVFVSTDDRTNTNTTTTEIFNAENPGFGFGIAIIAVIFCTGYLLQRR